MSEEKTYSSATKPIDKVYQSIYFHPSLIDDAKFVKEILSFIPRKTRVGFLRYPSAQQYRIPAEGLGAVTLVIGNGENEHKRLIKFLYSNEHDLLSFFYSDSKLYPNLKALISQASADAFADGLGYCHLLNLVPQDFLSRDDSQLNLDQFTNAIQILNDWSTLDRPEVRKSIVEKHEDQAVKFGLIKEIHFLTKKGLCLLDTDYQFALISYEVLSAFCAWRPDFELGIAEEIDFLKHQVAELRKNLDSLAHRAPEWFGGIEKKRDYKESIKSQISDAQEAQRLLETIKAGKNLTPEELNFLQTSEDTTVQRINRKYSCTLSSDLFPITAESSGNEILYRCSKQ